MGRSLSSNCGSSFQCQTQWMDVHACRRGPRHSPWAIMCCPLLYLEQPSTHRHQLAPKVPLNTFPLSCAASSALPNVLLPCHANNWSGPLLLDRWGWFKASEVAFSLKELFPASSHSAGKQVFWLFSIHAFCHNAITACLCHYTVMMML